MSVLVVHPQVQHSRRLVRALLERGILESFVTSLFGRPRFVRWLPAALADKFLGRSDAAIPLEKVRTYPYFELLWQLAVRFPGLLPVNRLLYYNLWAFDLLVSLTLSRSCARVVVGYETACLHLFRRAKRLGKLCVLDAASVHYKSQESPSNTLSRRMKERIDARKAEEIRLADRILVLSSYARDTFIANGVDAAKLTVIPLGIDCAAFAPETSAPHAPAEGITFLFVGNVTYAKGVDLLLRAFNEADIPGKRLVIAGAAGDASHLLRGAVPGVEVRGFVPHDRLIDVYRQADVFVLPSRLDGFGMVVAEAMAAGLPAIVSSHVGAQDLVSPGGNGWIFESGNSAALKNTMEQVYRLRADLAAFGRDAHSAMASHSWEHYQEVAGGYFCDLLDELRREDGRQ